MCRHLDLFNEVWRFGVIVEMERAKIIPPTKPGKETCKVN